MVTTHRVASIRWLALSQLLAGLECGVEAASRLDAHDRSQDDESVADTAHTIRQRKTNRQRAARFEVRLLRLDQRMDREVNRLTVERLALDLAQRRARDVELFGRLAIS